jgi:predicted alpha/beta-fold hydrolase
MKFVYALGLIACSVYYYKTRTRRQENNLLLVYSNSKLAKFYKLITDHFLETYADGLFYSGHAQTFLLEFLDWLLKLFKTNFNFFNFNYSNKEIFKLSDGGSIIIHHSKCSNLIKKKRKNKILVVIPGFTSKAEDYYIKNFLNDFVEEFDCRVMNLRGFGVKLTTPQMVSTRSYIDVYEYLNYCCKTNPDKKVFAVGFSFGGMLLARCLGSQMDIPNNLIGGCGLCYPICLKSVKEHVEPQLGGFYSKYGALNLKKCFQENSDVIFNSNFFSNDHDIIKNKVDLIDKIKNLNHVAEFDQIYTCKVFNINLEDYYVESKLDQYLLNIKIPFLSIFTKDDPIVPYEAVPLNTMRQNSNLITIISKKGGHMGFFKGLVPHRWIDIPIKTFIKTLNILYNCEEKECLSFYSSDSGSSNLIDDLKHIK